MKMENMFKKSCKDLVAVSASDLNVGVMKLRLKNRLTSDICSTSF